ncbi:MAG: hypothetical protein ACK5L3_13680 [Oscillospiraceae bacterium]
MSKQCRKLARRRERCIIERTGQAFLKIYQSGKAVLLKVPTFRITTLNKQQRIIAGLVAEQHIKDPRFANVRKSRSKTNTKSFGYYRTKKTCHGKKRITA